MNVYRMVPLWTRDKSAVEAAWGKVAQDIGEDPGYVITATHGKRAVTTSLTSSRTSRSSRWKNEVTKFFLRRSTKTSFHGFGSKFRNKSSAGPQTLLLTLPLYHLMARVSQFHLSLSGHPHPSP